MKVYEFRTRVRLPRLRPEVFAFFADAGNLEAITPPWLHFHVVTPQPIGMSKGALIDYRLRLHGIPLTRKTEITAWDPPRRFVDEQLRGPYRLWVHEHIFEEDGEGTIVEDYVRYSVPFGWLANRLGGGSGSAGDFGYREKKLREALG